MQQHYLYYCYECICELKNTTFYFIQQSNTKIVKTRTIAQDELQSTNSNPDNEEESKKEHTEEEKEEEMNQEPPNTNCKLRYLIIYHLFYFIISDFF